MRRVPTPAEAELWKLLRGSTLGVKFRRQHAIGQFVIDFYCAAARLVVEVDGESHDGRDEDDAARTQYLEAHGLRVLRFSNEEVLLRLDEVAERILREIRGTGEQNLTP
jgi:very-short-patch-repair endonuclease